MTSSVRCVTLMAIAACTGSSNEKDIGPPILHVVNMAHLHYCQLRLLTHWGFTPKERHCYRPSVRVSLVLAEFLGLSPLLHRRETCTEHGNELYSIAHFDDSVKACEVFDDLDVCGWENGFDEAGDGVDWEGSISMKHVTWDT